MLPFRKRRDAECDTHNYSVGAKIKDIISVIIPDTQQCHTEICGLQNGEYNDDLSDDNNRRFSVTRGKHFIGPCQKIINPNTRRMRFSRQHQAGHSLTSETRYTSQHHSPSHRCRFLASLANSLLWAESYCSRASECAKFDCSLHAEFS
jgi:hypothetical protein